MQPSYNFRQPTKPIFAIEPEEIMDSASLVWLNRWAILLNVLAAFLMAPELFGPERLLQLESAIEKYSAAFVAQFADFLSLMRDSEEDGLLSFILQRVLFVLPIIILIGFGWFSEHTLAIWAWPPMLVYALVALAAVFLVFLTIWNARHAPDWSLRSMAATAYYVAIQALVSLILLAMVALAVPILLPPAIVCLILLGLLRLLRGNNALKGVLAVFGGGCLLVAAGLQCAMTF
jgi:hypothetical protein